jgi:hypothetical protein
MLEGGYDLDALANCSGAVVGVLAGLDPAPPLATERATSGGPGALQLDRVADVWRGRW